MKKTVYLCDTDWRWHLGRDTDPAGAIVYNTLKSLKKRAPCWKQCGIVKIEMKQVKLVTKGKF